MKQSSAVQPGFRLRRCPFCGNRPDMIGYPSSRYFGVQCRNKECLIKPATRWHLVAAIVQREWNARCS